MSPTAARERNYGSLCVSMCRVKEFAHPPKMWTFRSLYNFQGGIKGPKSVTKTNPLNCMYVLIIFLKISNIYIVFSNVFYRRKVATPLVKVLKETMC